MLLGIPKEGLKPGSPEAADLQAAEAFVADIQQEILAYDIANAQAVESYARRWWSRVPILGRHTRRQLEEEEAAQKAGKGADGEAWKGGALAGLDAAAAAAAVKSGGPYLHSTSSTTARGHTVERTAAVGKEQLQSMGKANAKPAYNTWLFKRNHPNWVPLLQRWWVPWVCVGAIALVWTPDVWKLRTLYYLDYQYAMLRQSIHMAYWKATMSPEDYNKLMADIEAERPSSVKSTDCPF
ncbi:hypothetical protein AGDE_04765 [Angomonas deanei]|nr:hypothetical protein AGDE_06491 [Angomonas deanei]EPY39164.1 hypothetical protein AGDE_04765 [Angomonas deanei]|eukprot:EPY37443.1 hypothetical protein AGDE_06491 [Angomonas deanei]